MEVGVGGDVRGGGGDGVDERDVMLMMGCRTTATEEKAGDASADGRHGRRTCHGRVGGDREGSRGDKGGGCRASGVREGVKVRGRTTPTATTSADRL